MAADVTLTWEVTATEAGASDAPDGLTAATWAPANVPGTAIGALEAGGQWDVEHGATDGDPDDLDWWWRGRFATDASTGPWAATFEGIATLADVWLDGRHVLTSESAFASHDVDLGSLDAGTHELVVRCAALGPRLRERHPRGRWRSTLTPDQHLRWYRTPLVGRIPAWTPKAPLIGPWRPVRVHAPGALRVVTRRVRPTCTPEGGGVVAVDLELRGLAAELSDVVLRVGAATAPMAIERRGASVHASATIALDDAPRWWPHTHGRPARLPASVMVGDVTLELGSVGFRTIAADTSDGGFGLVVNDVPVFCRGVCWVPLDWVGYDVDPAALRRALVQIRDAGMNMVRVGGTMTYESAAFHDLCDELGLLVWQDLMLANVDPPDTPALLALLDGEVDALVEAIGWRPSLAVLCGSSEVEQQAAMVGGDDEARSVPVLTEHLAGTVARLAPELVYVPSTPHGGALAFRVGTGISHYFGVGAYERPLDDARLSGVRFAPECLAFANPPEPSAVDDWFGGPSGAGHSPAWKAGVARDNRASWDFEDTRDHYVGRLYGVSPAEVRRADPGRYLDLGRAAVGEAMAATFTEWRRPGSSCAGGLIWFVRDLRRGAGWGVVDVEGRPKSAYWYLRRVLAPVAVLLVDEGLDGLAIHVVNDGEDPVAATLELRFYAKGERLSESADVDLTVAPRSTSSFDAEELMGGFRDITAAYRFGPAAHDVVGATLRASAGERLAGATYLPLGRAREREHDVGLAAAAQRGDDGEWLIDISTRRFAQAVAIDGGDLELDDDWFDLAPGECRRLRTGSHDERPPRGEVRALNAVTTCRIEVTA